MNAAQKRKLLTELKKIYAEKQNLHYTDQEKFYDSPETHLQHHKSPSHVRTWLNMIRTTIQPSKRRVAHELKTKTNTIHSYFSVSMRKSSAKKHRHSRRSKLVKLKQNHQTYISFQFNSHQLQYHRNLPLAHRTLSPKLLQPEIPWASP